MQVSTFNFRAVSDRWQERQPLLKKTLKRMDSDVVCAQEVLTGKIFAVKGKSFVVGGGGGGGGGDASEQPPKQETQHASNREFKVTFFFP